MTATNAEGASGPSMRGGPERWMPKAPPPSDRARIPIKRLPLAQIES